MRPSVRLHRVREGSLADARCVERERKVSQLLTPWRAAKATDENLTSEDWAAIMEVCDRVSGDANGAQQSVQAMIKRLAHRNANVQLYTLEVSLAELPDAAAGWCWWWR